MFHFLGTLAVCLGKIQVKSALNSSQTGTSRKQATKCCRTVAEHPLVWLKLH